MKRWLLVVFALPFAVMAQKQHLVITGKITGLKENAQVLLTDAATGAKVATALVKSGSFKLTGKKPRLSVYQVSFPGSTTVLFDFFAANDAVSIAGSLDTLNSVVIKGDRFQGDFVAFKNQFIPYLNQLRSLADMINAEKDPKKKDSLMNVYTGIRADAFKATVQFVTNKPASPVSALALAVMTPVFNSLNDVEGYYVKLQAEARKGSFALELEKVITNSKFGTVGSMAIDFIQNDVTGKPVSLTSFRGQYVLVDFWASWCGPCRRENPNVVSAFNKYKNKKFTVLGVSLDESKPDWLQAIAADKLAWTHVSDLKSWNNTVAKLYRIQSIPANILVDPNGKIVGKDLRGAELDKVLRDLLKSN